MRESTITRQTRVEAECNQLEMGRLPHSAFLSEWERMLIVMDDAGMKQPDEATLFRRYLQKLVPELRATLLSRTWVFPQDPSSPPRKPRTWAECAECAAQELESRADAKAQRWSTPFQSERCTLVVIASGRTTTWRSAPREPPT